MLVWMMLLGCQPVENPGGLLDPIAFPQTVEAKAPAAAEGEKPVDPRFAAYDEAVANQDDPWNTDKTGPGDKAEGAEATEEADDAEGDAAADAEGIDDEDLHFEGGPEDIEEEGDDEDADEEPVGVPTEAAWGVRLVQTFENRQPPRASMGMPDGEEIIVSPGSMLPDVGLVVISVGHNMVQLAKVTPAGDHATIETTTLHAQYQAAGATAGN